MILFFYGDNDFMIRHEVDRLRQHYKKTVGSALSLEIFDLADRPMGDVIDSAAAAPLFESSRLMVLRGLEKSKTPEGQIEKLIEMVPDSTVLIIEAPGIDRRSKAFKSLAVLPKATEFRTLTPGQLQSWVAREAKKLGAQIDQKTILHLLERVGNDQWRLHSELQKLASYNEVITTESINQLSSPRIDTTIFALIEQVAAGEIRASLQTYDQLAADGVADQQIIAMLNWHYRNIALAIDNLTARDTAWTKAFGISPFAIQKATRLANHLDLSDCLRAYNLIIAADESIKSGQKTSRTALIDLIYALTN